MNMQQLLLGIVSYGSLILLVFSIVLLCISLRCLEQKREKEFWKSTRIASLLMIKSDGAEDTEINSEVLDNIEIKKAIIETALKKYEREVESKINMEDYERILKGYRRRIMLYYWAQRKELAKKRVEELLMSIAEYDIKIKKSENDKVV